MQSLSLIISQYSALILLPIMIIEGPIITIIASFLASLGILNIVLVYFLALLGNIIGDVGYYSIGRYGRETFIKKYGKYIGLHEKNIKTIESHYNDHLFKTILIAKVTEAPVVPTLIAAGLARTDFRKFIAVCVTAEIPKVFILVLIGRFFGRFYTTIEAYFKDFIITSSITFIVIVVTVLVYRKFKLKNL